MIEIKTSGNIFQNLSVKELVEIALTRKEGFLAGNGALVVMTGERTGRSPKDRYVIENASTKDEIWWGEVNRPASEEKFEHLYKRISEYLSQKDLFVCDAYAGADMDYRLPVRVIAEKAWHALFAKTLFLRPTESELKGFVPEFTVIDACDLKLNPETDGFDSRVTICMDLTKKIILIAGSGYGGEVKKGIFAVMNYLLPHKNIFPMHCSANVGANNDSALFFGLSGTGKTTLSADPQRKLIGDDEHGWSDNGIFNFEGGCYAKVIRLSKEAEPQIYNAIKSGSILENVVVDRATGEIDYDSDKITENTRATYPVEHIPNCVLSGVGDHPKNIFFLTCDAFGVLPPISKLTPEQAMYHYISGYTAKVAGTEVGITEPTATFSACFGAPFLPLHPNRYAELLRDKLHNHNATCWLVNTGWSGGAYGQGQRMKIKITRALLSAALSGALTKVEFKPDPIFKVLVPESCPEVPTEVLSPINTWTDKAAYKATSAKLAKLFQDNLKKYQDKVSVEVINAGPVV